MRALKKTLLTAAMAAGLSYGASAQAFVVDLFDDPAANGVQVATTTTVGPAGTVAVEYPGGAVPSPSILGGYRDIIVSLTASNGIGTPNATAEVGGGGYSFSTSSGDRGTGRIQWDGQDAGPNVGDLNYTGLNGANLINQVGCPSSGCDRFVATVLVADLGFEYQIGVYTDENNYSILTANTIFAVESPTPAVYLFDWFQFATGTYEVEPGFFIGIEHVGVVDFTNIGALEFVVNSDGATVAVDLALDSITKVPEPGVLALMGIGLLGATFAGRRRQGVKA